MPACTAIPAPPWAQNPHRDRGWARLGLADRAHDKTAQLSGGKPPPRRGWRAHLLHEPRLLLMDEATVGLDPQSRSDLLKAHAEQCARSVLLRCSGRRICATRWATPDRVIVLHRGKVLADTTPRANSPRRAGRPPGASRRRFLGDDGKGGSPNGP